jgi:Cdc6-like AAA superfamily ATPase
MTAEEQREANYFIDLGIKVGTVFTPNAPIDKRSLFSGRTSQIRRVSDIIFQKGNHAIIFGERGVGKTSLAQVLQEFLPTQQNLVVTRVNCDAADNFLSVWKKVFDGISFVQSRTGMGYAPQDQIELFSLASFLKETENVPHQVFKALQQVPSEVILVVIIDEFDRLGNEVRPLFADFIKMLSDNSLPITIILTGVGESVDELVSNHQSVSRSMAQIQMPRMTNKEIEDIITNGLMILDGMTISDTVLQKIVLLAKGLPHYAHLLGLHVCRDALDNQRKDINDDNMNHAIIKALEDCQRSIRTNYFNGIRSTKKISLFVDVLLACALAEVNELGEFSVGDLRHPLQRITGKNYEIPAFAKHLSEFCESKRGNILIKTGERKRFRYKFRDPLMQPFIIMQGITNGKNL